MNDKLLFNMPKHIESIGDGEMFTITEIASMVGFTTKSVTNWIDNGLLCAYKFGVSADDKPNDDSNAGLRIFGSDLKNFFKQSQVIPKRFRQLRDELNKT